MYGKVLSGSIWRGPRTHPFWDRPDQREASNSAPGSGQEETSSSDGKVAYGDDSQRRATQNENLSEAGSDLVRKGAGVRREAQSADADIHQTLLDLRSRTETSLRLFNNTVPHASWLRRSEIDRLTSDIVWAVAKAPQRRRPTPFGQIKNALSWVGRLKASARVR
jgi:hypothetical protein